MERRNHIEDSSVHPEGQLEEYSDDGVDLTLIRWMLSLSPAERLRALEQNVSAILRLRSGRNG